MRRLAPLFALLAAGCVTTLTPKRRPVAEGSPVTFYPKACVERGGFDGNIVIKGGTNLGPLAEAPCVTGSVTVEATPLERLALPNLAEIGGDLIVRDVGRLEAVELPALRLVAGAALFLNAPRLETLALPELLAVGDHLMVGRHPDLDAGLSPDAPGSAVSAVELPALRAVSGAVVLRNNPALTRFTLPKLDRIGDGLFVEDNRRLIAFDIAPRAELLRTVTFARNAALSSLEGFGARTALQGDLRVEQNGGLARLGASALARVDGDLHLARNPSLRSADLPALETVGGTVEVLDHQVLDALAWPVLRKVGGRLEISSNPSLVEARFLALATVKDNLDVTASFALTTLELPALGRIGGDLGVVDNPALPVLGAPQLEVIEDNLVVKGNASLQRLAFPALERVEGYLTIQGNPELASLAGLPALTFVKVKLFVRDNPRLPRCAATGLRDQLAPERPMWGEEIGDNDPDGTCPGA